MSSKPEPSPPIGANVNGTLFAGSIVSAVIVGAVAIWLLIT